MNSSCQRSRRWTLTLIKKEKDEAAKKATEKDSQDITNLNKEVLPSTDPLTLRSQPPKQLKKLILLPKSISLMFALLLMLFTDTKNLCFLHFSSTLDCSSIKTLFGVCWGVLYFGYFQTNHSAENF